MKIANYVSLVWPCGCLHIAMCALLLVCSCAKAPSINGDAAATHAFWEALQKEEDYTDVAAALTAWEASPATAEVQVIRSMAVMEVASAMLTQRNEYIGKLSMKDVDPVLLDYVARLAAGKNSGNRYELDFAMAYQKRGESWVMLGLRAVHRG